MFSLAERVVWAERESGERKSGGSQRANERATRRRREFMKVGVVSHDDELVAELLMPASSSERERAACALRTDDTHAYPQK